MIKLNNEVLQEFAKRGFSINEGIFVPWGSAIGTLAPWRLPAKAHGPFLT